MPEAPKAQLNPDTSVSRLPSHKHRAFPSFSNGDFRIFFFGATAAMMLVQLNAPGEIRGRVLGVFSMSAMGLRTFSGLSVGLLGSMVGIHNSLSYSAAVLFLLYTAIFVTRHVVDGRVCQGASDEFAPGC